MGYHRAGFDVVGVDLYPQRHYPFQFIQADAIKFLEGLIRLESWCLYDAIHASPPCQAFTQSRHVRPENTHPDLITPTRELLRQIPLPYIIENVVGAPLEDPTLLCGAMFPELRVYRHRLFETNFEWAAPAHPDHVHPITKMGRPPKDGEFMHVVGHFSGVPAARKAMDIDWMTRNELKEAIPPAYTELIARQIPVNREIPWRGESGNPDYSNPKIAPGGETENAGIRDCVSK